MLQQKHPLIDSFSCAACLKGVKSVEQECQTAAARALEAAQMLEKDPCSVPLAEAATEALQVFRVKKDALDDMRKHIELWHHQRQRFVEQLNNLDLDTLLVVQDFASFEVLEGEKLPDLVLTLHFKDRQTGETVHVYLDMVPEGKGEYSEKKRRFGPESKNWVYVANVWQQLYDNGVFALFKKIAIWSDTGPNHFRVSSTLYFFRQLQTSSGIDFAVHFFAPYHGHNSCDGHVGAAKRHLEHVRKLLVEDQEGWDRNWVIEHVQECRNTVVVKLTIDRALKVERAKLKGIKQFLSFEFPQSEPLGVRAFDRTGGTATNRMFSLVANDPPPVSSALFAIPESVTKRQRN